jgi:hypothetical protein
MTVEAHAIPELDAIAHGEVPLSGSYAHSANAHFRV